MTIVGTNLSLATGIKFGATSELLPTPSAMQLIVKTKPESAGKVSVSITTPNGTATDANAFTFVARPTIASVSPTSGPDAGGTSVTIAGTKFRAGSTSVYVGVNKSPSVTVLSTTKVSAKTPAGATGTVNVSVTTPGGTATDANAFKYVAGPKPTVTLISPPDGPTTGESPVTITGTGFSAAHGATVFSFGPGKLGSGVICSTSTSCTAATPPGVTGTVDVRATVEGSTSAANPPKDQFTYTTVPTVTQVSPPDGPTSGGSTVTISGTGFAMTHGATALHFGPGEVATNVNCTATACTAVTPPGAAGTVDVTATVGGATSVVNPPEDQFTYATPPTVTQVSPPDGPTIGGSTLMIMGTGFSVASDATVFNFGPGNAVVGINCTATTCAATAPPHAPGTVDVTATVAGATSAVSSADQFIYDPSVTGITPDGGPTTGGTSVAISGTGFSMSGTSFDFGPGNPVAGTCTSSTSCTAVSPSGAVGTVDVTATAAGASSAAGSADQFTYGPAVTTVMSVTPDYGSSVGSSVVTITGSGFSTGANVTVFDFGPGNLATSVNCTSTTRCTLVTPPGNPGNVDVTASAGGAASAPNAGDEFEYFSGALSVLVQANNPAGLPGLEVGSADPSRNSETVSAYVKFGSVLVGGVPVRFTLTGDCGTNSPGIVATDANPEDYDFGFATFTYAEGSAPAGSCTVEAQELQTMQFAPTEATVTQANLSVLVQANNPAGLPGLEVGSADPSRNSETVSAYVKFGSVLVGGVPVRFTLTGDCGTNSPGIVATDANPEDYDFGFATFTYAEGSAPAGSCTVEAQELQTMQFAPTEATVTQANLSVLVQANNPAGLPGLEVGSADPSRNSETVSAYVKFGSVLVGGVPVRFTLTGDCGTNSPGIVATDANPEDYDFGFATFTYAEGSAPAGSCTVEAQELQTMQFAPTEATVTQANLSVLVQANNPAGLPGLEVGSADPSRNSETVSAYVKFGSVLVGGVPVRFTLTGDCGTNSPGIVATDPDPLDANYGFATFTYEEGSAPAGSCTVEAQELQTMQFAPIEATVIQADLSISLQSSLLAGSNSYQVTAIVRFGSTSAEGVTVGFTFASGADCGTLSQPSQMTDTNGSASVSYQPGAPGGACTIKAQEQESLQSAQITISQ